LAERVLAGDGGDRERVALLIGRVYGRAPRAGELDRMLAFLATYPTETRSEAWKRLCHSLLISNEFLYRS
jgi:hypothetical protein